MSKAKKNKLEDGKAEKSIDELYQLLEDFIKEQMNLKLQKSLGQLTSPHRVRIVRRNIARVKTLIHISEGQAA